jgi:hypothetical protein
LDSRGTLEHCAQLLTEPFELIGGELESRQASDVLDFGS